MTIEFIKQIPIFKDLPNFSMELIIKKIKKLSFKKGEMIFSEMDEAKGVFFVKKGVVKLSKGDSTGKEVVVCIKKTGDLFAEACLFTEPGTCYPATAHMFIDGEVLFLKTEDLEEGLMIHPELGVEIVRYMSVQLRNLTTIVRDIALLDVYSKTISTLARLARDFGDKDQQNCVNINLQITIQEFANIIGTTRESVSRVFSKLKHDHIIEIHNKKIVICDWCKFCSIYSVNQLA